jgi:type VI secretion system protein ImpC
MSTGEAQSQAAAAPAEATAAGGLLDQITSVMPRAVDKPRRDELIRSLVEESLKGTVKFDKNVARTITRAIAAIDAAMSKQLAAVMHHEQFQKLESAWRGLHYLVMNSETGAQLKIRVMNVTKRELFKDLEKAVEFDQSLTFKKIYEAEFGSPGGEPYGTIIGDYEFTAHP